MVRSFYLLGLGDTGIVSLILHAGKSRLKERFGFWGSDLGAPLAAYALLEPGLWLLFLGGTDSRIGSIGVPSSSWGLFLPRLDDFGSCDLRSMKLEIS